MRIPGKLQSMSTLRAKPAANIDNMPSKVAVITGAARFGEYMGLGKSPRLRPESLCWLIIAHVKSSTCQSQPGFGAPRPSPSTDMSVVSTRCTQS
jgi:hypothetical protein